MQRTRLLLVAAALAAVVTALAACGGDDDEAATSAPAATATSPATTEETTTEAEPTPPPPAAPPVTTIRIVIVGGKPQDGIVRQTVKQGALVRLVVRSDVADEVHLHGYELMRDVAPGEPATIAFTASIAGQFEAELEDRGLQIAELEVRP